jgi:peptide deformylase
MAILPILTEPDPKLRMKATSVSPVTPEVERTLDDMVDTMLAAPGIGLAAPQVGISKRMLVVNQDGCLDEPTGVCSVLKIINPEIIAASEETFIFDEGCLSIPGFSIPVTRPKEIVVRYQTPGSDGFVTLRTQGLLGICIQHEIDHLNGILTIDYLEDGFKQEAIQKLNARKAMLATPETSSSVEPATREKS